MNMVNLELNQSNVLKSPKVSLLLESPQSLQPAWMEFAGIFKDDEDFASIMESINREKNSNDDLEIDPGYYL